MPAQWGCVHGGGLFLAVQVSCRVLGSTPFPSTPPPTRMRASRAVLPTGSDRRVWCEGQ